MKKALSVILCLTLIAGSILVFTACGKQGKEKEDPDTTNTESGGEIAGGWVKADSPVITEDFKKLFEKAVIELVGGDYVPVAYLGSQVVAGTNHRVLCKESAVVPGAKTTYAIMTIYEDLGGKTKILEVMPSDVEAPRAESGLAGGWTETETPEMTDEAKKALDKACETLTGAEYTPVALLATQVVAGTNYRIVCESKATVPNAESETVIVTVYADLKGNAEITDVASFRHVDGTEVVSEDGNTPLADTKAAVNGNIKTYYEMNDGTWMCDDIVYQYRLEITGRMPNAAVDSTFVYLSNLKEISFEQAYKAAGVSSSSEDNFSPEEAVLVETD